MRVAVVVVNFNSGDWLCQCLEGLQRQSMQPELVLVIDNASSDQSFANAMSSYPGYRFLQNGANVGFAAANNSALRLLADLGFTHAALLNPDAIPEENWLERLAEAANTNAQVASFASRMMVYGEHELVDGLGDAYHISGFCWRIGHGRPLPPGFAAVNVEVFGACAGAALYDITSVLEVGAFDEDFFCYVEDVDLAFRLNLAGHTSLLVPEAVVQHVGSASTGRRSEFATYHGQRNLEWTFLKNMPLGLLILFMPLHAAAVAISVIIGLTRGNARTVVAAKIDALRGTRAVLKKRRDIQMRRVASAGDLWRRLDRSVWMPNS